ncbi:MAG: DUF1993 domain-containing protein [Pseudomonadota bacterium]
MSTSLYDLSVASYLQIVAAADAFLANGASHISDEGGDLDAVVATRLYPDMADFHFQVQCIGHHSLGAINGVMQGEFSPPPNIERLDYAGLQALVSNAVTELNALRPDDVNSHAGKTVTFKLGETQIPFTAENFVMSFSLPNMYFHATTAYDILRAAGVPVGKRDFLGNMRMGA